MYRFQNVSRRPRERFNFPADSWVESLPCLPCIKARGTHPTYYPEFFMFPGPRVVGDPGDNTLQDLISRTYAFLFCDDFTWYVLRWSDGTEVAPGLDSPGWETITELLPPLAELTGVERSFSGAFDQSARLNVAYEINETVKVTRWDPELSAFVQNVEFPGVDPVLVFDATWSYDVPNSDVLLFYLSTDRTKLMVRVQRDVYAVEYELHDFGSGAVVDRVQRLPLRFEVLASDAVGVPLTGEGARIALVSQLYPYPAREGMGIAGVLDEGALEFQVWRREPTESLVVGAAFDEGEYIATVLHGEGSEALGIAAALDEGALVFTVYRETPSEAFDIAAALDEGAYVFSTFRATGSESLVIAATLDEGSYELE